MLKHLGLWEIKARPPPRAIVAAKNPEYHIDYSTSQVPVSDNLSRAPRPWATRLELVDKSWGRMASRPNDYLYGGPGLQRRPSHLIFKERDGFKG
jgi:hypothetical protein